MGRTLDVHRTQTSRYHPQPSWTVRNKQRASLSFFIVVIFFAVFGMIVFTELFVIDERNRNGGYTMRNGILLYRSHQEKNEYEEDLQGDNFPKALDNGIEALLAGEQFGVPIAADNLKSQGYILPNSMGTQISSGSQINVPLADGIWQNVAGTTNKFFVYSAYFDRREPFNFIRIIGATKTRGHDPVFCRFWYPLLEKNSTKYISTNTTANVKVIRENWNLKYSAVYVNCPLKKGQAVPTAVSIFSKPSPTPTNTLIVNNFYNETQLPTKKYAVCVKPLHYNYDKMMQIVEFIELNRIMGVEHFVFYNHTVGHQVDCLLREYISKGVVTLLPWDLDLLSQKEIRTEGLFAAMNDCLYRTMYRFSHVLFIDFDEYIIPRSKPTLPELIENLQRQRRGPEVGAYSFQNAFFYLQWDDDEWTQDTQDVIALNLVTQKKTRRKSKLHPHKQRSKYICRPEKVVEVGNHFVWEFIRGFVSYNIPSDHGILHHYRICEFGGDDCVKQASTVDRTAFKYRTELVEAVKSVYDNNKDKCDLEDLYMSERQQIAAVPFIDIFNKDFKRLLDPNTR
ncbi:beta-1,4-galactosyltransferase galt-1 isoform X2 [Agrilus planipennis]|nr:beta-1,4-galactosyltransferase galt-1 isoform X2 [Agrilus planipennis]XP_018322194.1 beta-1,4-galactosyltransferase galt-1 isoform X2 [Agrilus planipennis]XP_018322195.1 beta-1,4-galactosyltransferase galt-1 isoform X2 [Agrilus planipennis]